jgi:hypothetical protein
MHDPWKGINVITSRSIGLGESSGYFIGDAYPGFCRYFIVLGTDSVARGPAMSNLGFPVFSRPDLRDPFNLLHADPFKIWGPVMTNGLRMVLGLTGYQYCGTGDREAWKKFADYWRNSYSIAHSFAEAARSADARHMPVVLIQAGSEQACFQMLQGERYFSPYRPSGNVLLCKWWTNEGLRSYDGYYIWSCPGRVSVQSQATEPEETASAVQNAVPLKGLHVLGYTESASTEGQAGQKRFSKTDDKRQLWTDERTGTVYYRDTEASEVAPGPCVLTVEQSIEKAASFIADNALAALNELTLDGVVTIRQMIATADEVAANKYSHTPEIVGYLIVLKRNLGDLHILTDNVDTITVEIGANGEVASAVSNYRSGRTVEEREAVVPRFSTVEEAKKNLVAPDVDGDVTAGLLPTDDGTYLPVYKVTTPSQDPESSSSAQVRYLRMDTLAPVESEEGLAGNAELQGPEAAPQQIR